MPTKEERKEERVPTKEERVPTKDEYSWQNEKLTFVVSIVFYRKKRRLKSFEYIFCVHISVITQYTLLENGAMFVQSFPTSGIGGENRDIGLVVKNVSINIGC